MIKFPNKMWIRALKATCEISNQIYCPDLSHCQSLGPEFITSACSEHLQCLSYLSAARPICQSLVRASACSVCSFSQLSLCSPRQLHMGPSGGTWRTWCGTRKTGPTTCPITSHMPEVLLGLVYWVPPPHHH